MSELREALKPCPFCGGAGELCQGIGGFVIQCNRCHASTCSGPGAAERWNTRAALAQPKAVEPVAWMSEDHLKRLQDGCCGLVRLASNGSWAKFNQELNVPIYTTPPLAPDERMRRALEFFVAGMKSLSRVDEGKESEINEAPLCKKCGYHATSERVLACGNSCPMRPSEPTPPDDNHASDTRDFSKVEIDEGGWFNWPKNASDGKESEGISLSDLPTGGSHPGIGFGHKTFVRQLVDDPNSASGKSLRDVEVQPSDPTPPDATAQREAIARIIDPIAWYRTDEDPTDSHQQRRQYKAYLKADEILARAGG